MRLALVLLVLALAMPATAQLCSPACDLDGDGATGTPSDYGVFFGAFGTTKGQPGYSPKADLDSDGAVTPTDWSLMQKFCPLGR